VVDVFGLIVVLAIITTIVSHKNTASVISATGTAFGGALRAAQGR
jgi:hypothetical protein